MAKRKTVDERFWSKVTPTGFCWEWNPAPEGEYGRFWFNKRVTLAHRVAYQLLIGPIPEGLVIDHLCRNPRCVNPDHLEPVSMGENSLRGQHPRFVVKRTGRCAEGHDMRDAYVTNRGLHRCRPCTLAYQKKGREARHG